MESKQSKGLTLTMRTLLIIILNIAGGTVGFLGYHFDVYEYVFPIGIIFAIYVLCAFSSAIIFAGLISKESREKIFADKKEEEKVEEKNVPFYIIGVTISTIFFLLTAFGLAYL